MTVDKAIYILFAWLAVMSIVLFVMMGTDKKLAKAHARRIPEARLFLFALIGGAVGGTLGMYAFRHKTKHWYFALGFPAIALVQLAAAVWLTIR